MEQIETSKDNKDSHSDDSFILTTEEQLENAN